MGNKKTDWLYKTIPQRGLNGRSLNYPRGKVLGGCSSINGMIYMRGQSQDYDHWRQLGNIGWGWDDVLPYFIKTEDNYSGSNNYHGSGGEWRVDKQRLHWEVLDDFRDAVSEIGIPKISDFNNGNNFGVSYFKVNQKNGFRLNTSQAFLKPIKKNKNLKIFKNSEVSNLIIKKKSVIGVNLLKNGKSFQVYCNKEVILSCGSIGTPKILELSGIGNPIILKKAGVIPVLISKNVGENLQDHLQLRVIFKLKNAKT
jgi:Choline dehydrogenase and related flavoproteins